MKKPEPPKGEDREEGPEAGMAWWIVPLLFLALIVGVLMGVI